jgi:hypothetical protein
VIIGGDINWNTKRVKVLENYVREDPLVEFFLQNFDEVALVVVSR